MEHFSTKLHTITYKYGKNMFLEMHANCLKKLNSLTLLLYRISLHTAEN